jgi:hypothetical protein
MDRILLGQHRLSVDLVRPSDFVLFSLSELITRACGDSRPLESCQQPIATPPHTSGTNALLTTSYSAETIPSYQGDARP